MPIIGTYNGPLPFFRVLINLINNNIIMIIKPYFQTSAAEWRKVFFLSIGFYFLANLFYLLFMSGEVQYWNEPQPSGTVGK